MTKRIFTCLSLAVVLFLTCFSVQASQTNQKLKETGDKIDQLQEQKKAAEQKVGDLKETENGLQGNLAGLNRQMSEVSIRINELEDNIAKKETEIAAAAQQLAETKEQKNKQYESMKLRIQFIYENGGADLASVLLTSTSMADLLSRAEYVEEINKYDRKMLDLYQKICEQVSEKEQNLQTEKQELLSLQTEMEQKKEKVDSLIAETKDSIASTQAQISEAKDTVSDYEAQIAKMKAYEEELERKKAQEAKKQAEARKKNQQSASPQGGGTVTANASDLAMLSALVECEAGGEGYDGQLAVASVVVNRVRSGSFPNTVSGVIYQGGQFSPVASGRFAMVLARGAGGSCVQAAQAALSGSTNVKSLYFCRASSGVEGTVIGNHVFY